MLLFDNLFAKLQVFVEYQRHLGYNKCMSTYFNERDQKNLAKLRELRKQLPAFCGGYFTANASRFSTLTRLAYAGDLLIFFDYIIKNTSTQATTPAEYTLQELDSITSSDLDEYLEHLSFYTYNGKTYSNDRSTKLRKISAVRSLFQYLYNRGLLKENVSSKIMMPAIHDKEIVRLEPDEMENLLFEVESAHGTVGHAKAYHEHTRERDIAIVTLLLGTGIRISECVGLDISDVDMTTGQFTITRKGGSRTILYMPEEVQLAIADYLSIRNATKTDTNALFLSLQNKRIGVRSVQMLVKKYAVIAVPLKHITPHKLRSTFGTNLYRETKDIYIVAELLGHSDVNTTKKHYAAISEDIKREASKVVHLRAKKDDE